MAEVCALRAKLFEDGAVRSAVLQHSADGIAGGLGKAGDFASAVARFGCFADLLVLALRLWLRAGGLGRWILVLGFWIHNGLFIFWC